MIEDIDCKKMNPFPKSSLRPADREVCDIAGSGASDIGVAPMANPISARRMMPLTKKFLTGEAGCCTTVANELVQNRYRLISPASIRYSGQCRRKLAATPKLSFAHAASGVLN